MEEIFDITDDNGVPTGKTVTRSKAHEEGIPHRTAHIWIVRKEGDSYQVLLQKRSAEKESFPSMYDTSSAGHIQAGDEPLESARRELFEELGIKAEDGDLKFAGRFHIKYAMPFHGKIFNDNEVAFVYVYEKPVDAGSLVLQKEEVEEVKWFDIDEVISGCEHRDGTFCVPTEGLDIVLEYLGLKSGFKVERQKVKEQFASYTRNYDPTDPKIALKIAHTYRVADNCEQIARSIGLSDEDVEFAWLSGMLHDIGRFEQVKRYNTFIDSQSVDHAEFGADLLFGMDKLILGYIDDRSRDAQLETVIRQHNKYRIASEVTGRTLVFCNILRDADKVDILRVNVETPMEEIYNVTEDELLTSGVSDIVMEQVREHHAVQRDIMVSPAEHLIGHIALTFELVYPKSLKLAKEQGYLYKMFDFPTRNSSTKAALIETRHELETLHG